MPATEPHTNQHWIPISYTAAWADPSVPAKLGKRVHIYNPDGSYRNWRYPKQLFSLPDYYTLPGHDGARDLRIEAALGRIESAFARTRRSVLEKGRPIGDRHKTILACFVAALRSRTPSSHEHLMDFWKRVVAKGDRMSALFANSPDEQRAAILKTSSFSSSDRGASMSLEEAREIASMKPGETTFAQLEVEAPLLARLHVSILTTDAEPGFITSDRPVVWWDPTKPRGKSMFGVGLGNRNVEITVPVSPRQCLLFTHRKGATDYVKIGDESRDVVNLRTLAHCENIWIATRAGLAVNWLGEDETPAQA